MTGDPEPGGRLSGTLSTEIALSAAGVLKRFGPHLVLGGIDLSVARGEIVAIRGRSGSGKSTLLLCLAGILPIDEGSILFGDLDLGLMSERDRTRLRCARFGFVFQSSRLLPELHAVENVELPLRLAGSERGGAHARALEWLQRVDLGPLADRPVGSISGGEAQRVAIARALVSEPEVVFADEPTGSLDATNGDLVMTHLVGAAREAGATVLLVTHDDRVASYADRCVMMVDGRLEHAG